ncbi:MAG: hypothetical protein IJU80_04705 [Lachnospiraceae bacterium]|nr:hypothetical protein [Lachnospiraceae bacterium]
MEKELEIQPKTEAGWRARLRGNRSKSEKDAEYVPVIVSNGRICQGGNQSWWLSLLTKLSTERQEQEKQRKHTKRKDQKRISPSRYQMCRRDEDYRIASLGCGVIAMTNLELYLKTRTTEKTDLVPRLEGPTKALAKSTDGAKAIMPLPKEEYLREVGNNWKATYRIGKSYVNYLTGLYPWKMEAGLRKCLLKLRCSRTRVQWAPYVGKPQNCQKQMVLDTICDMLEQDYPVVCAYHTFSPKEHSLILYHELGLAVRGANAEGRYDKVSSHYMTIIGCYVAETGCTILQMESWGRLYYVRYDEYAKRLNYFTNILRIYE